jgi:hypothetical protein
MKILAFPVERVECIECGAPFRRRRGEHWKRRCSTCWAWLQIWRAHQRARHHFRELRK